MSQIINQTDEYNTVTENELSVILASFETQFIYSVIQDNLNAKYSTNFIGVERPNVVRSFEDSFKNLFNTYPMDHENIKYTRQVTYEEIIDILCQSYNLSKTQSENNLLDKFALAYYMYDLLISNFSKNIINFYTRYIIQEKNAIYSYFNLDALKKNKDSSTIYGRKTYKDPKLAIINANLLSILDNMQAFDISFENICSFVYPDKSIVDLICQNISPTIDFYKTYYCEIVRNPDIKPLFITSIRLEIQKYQ